MFIDRFTEYELAIIRRELREIQKLSKDSVNKETWAKIDEIFDKESYTKEMLFPYRAVGDALTTLADYTLDNFIYKKQGRSKKQIGWYRSQNIDSKIEEEYKQVINEFLDVIKKHRKQKKFSLLKPAEDKK